jgi:hypothetical protein
VYAIAGAVLDLEALTGTPYQEWLRNGLAVVSAIAAFVVNFRDARARATARALTTQVDEELKKKAREGDAGSVAAVSTADVAAQVTASSLEDRELAQLIEQRKQRLLVDKKTLSAELRYLVEHWHPLPRDVKRGLNRFYMTYLVAYNRGLLKAGVTGMQLAKWLVLSERWPQLGRALAAWPQRMQDLEAHAHTPGDAVSDRFPDLIRALAPLYADDHALRSFVGSNPKLAAVLPSLVQFGAVQGAPTTGDVVAQSVTAVPQGARQA